jgi:hypothetical protein
MSRLSVYWPDECDSGSTAVAEAPMIIPFPRDTQDVVPPRRLDVVSRARALFDNRRCRHCHHPLVEPVQLDDALVNSSGLEIPGTATLVGFQCRSCRASWSV